MGFRKDVTIYQKGKVHIYVNQCHNKGRKTKLFAVRRDDETGYAHLLGTIKWSGRWWQYVFFPKRDTMWSSGCMDEISLFLKIINKQERKRWAKQREICVGVD